MNDEINKICYTSNVKPDYGRTKNGNILNRDSFAF